MAAPRRLAIAAALALCLLFAPPCRAAEASGPEEAVAVIVNIGNDVGSLSIEELRSIYTNNILKWQDGTPIRIYDLVLNSTPRETFSEKVLGRSPARVAEQWAHLKITNQAKNPPHTIKSEMLIIKRVSREKGAIGYVSLDRVEGVESVRVVATLR